MLYMFF